MSGRQPRALADVSEAAWQEACRREVIVRPLATGLRLCREGLKRGLSPFFRFKGARFSGARRVALRKGT